MLCGSCMSLLRQFYWIGTAISSVEWLIMCGSYPESLAESWDNTGREDELFH